MKLILELKHWQLFLIMLLFYWLQRWRGDGSLIASLMVTLLIFGWLWSLASYGQKMLAAKGITTKNTVLFASNIAYVCVFDILLTIFKLQPGYQPYLPQLEKALGWLCLGYVIFASFQVTWFTARTLSVLENLGEYSRGTTVVYFL